jgi:hypothetical protein
MAYSTDGVTWTVVADSEVNGTAINSIAYGGGRFVAVGSSGQWLDDGSRTSNNGTIAYSNMQE